MPLSNWLVHISPELGLNSQGGKGTLRVRYSHKPYEVTSELQVRTHLDSVAAKAMEPQTRTLSASELGRTFTHKHTQRLSQCLLLPENLSPLSPFKIHKNNILFLTCLITIADLQKYSFCDFPNISQRLYST